MREPDWTPEEFELLLSRPDLDDAALATVIQTRTAGAIGVVRAGVCQFHRRQDGGMSILSRMMQERLANPPRRFVCRLCGERI